MSGRVLVLLMCVIQVAWSEERVYLTSYSDNEIGNYVYYLEQDSSPLSIEEVMASTSWLRNRQPSVSFGYQPYPTWLKIHIQPMTSQTWYLSLRYLTIDFIDFYWVKNNAVIQHDRSGDRVSVHDKSSKTREISTYIHLDANETVTLYMLVDTEGPTLLPMTLHSDQAYIESASKIDFAFGMYYGLLFVMAIYNFIIYMITRAHSYLFYVLYTVSGIFGRASFDGVGNQFLWPQNPDINAWILPLTFWLSAVFYLAFTGAFLNISRKRKAGYVVYLGLVIWMAIAGVIALFTDYAVHVQILTLSSGVLLIWGFFYALSQAFRGRSYAAIFAMAIFCSMCAYVVAILGTLAVINDSYFAMMAYPVARTIEVVLFAVALGVRIRYLSNRKDQAERETKAAKDQALKSLEQFERLYENSLVGNAILDDKGTVQRANETFLEKMAIEKHAQGHVNIRQCINNDAFSSALSALQEHASSSEIEVKTPHGRWLSIRIYRIHMNDAHEYECALIDITDTKKAIELREKSQEDEINALQHLVVGVSHEINTPLGVVATSIDHVRNILYTLKDNFTQGKLKKQDFEKEVLHGKEVVSLAVESVKRLRLMTDSFAKSSSLQMHFNFAELNLQAMLEEQRQTAQSLGLRVSTHIHSEKGIVFNTYPQGINWILSELTHNVAAHGVDDQHPLASIEIQLDIELNDEGMTIIFSDNGAGVQQVDIAEILHPFVTSKRGSGQKIGLGLYQVYNIVQQFLKGSIEMQNGESAGVSVHLYVPNLSK